MDNNTQFWQSANGKLGPGPGARTAGRGQLHGLEVRGSRLATSGVHRICTAFTVYAAFGSPARNGHVRVNARLCNHTARARARHADGPDGPNASLASPAEQARRDNPTRRPNGFSIGRRPWPGPRAAYAAGPRAPPEQI
eukprot:13364546-Alexandrium_andersonii.AAC.1